MSVHKSSTPRVIRIIKMLEHLRTLRFGTSTPQLAERFGVSVRQVFRDLDTLRDAGVQLETDRGSGGGIRLHVGGSHGR